MRSSSLPAPVSTMAIPAVACGTNTCSSPSPPPATSRRNEAQSPVRSHTTSLDPVATFSIRDCMSALALLDLRRAILVVFDDGIGTREDEGLMPVVEDHQVRR